MIVFILDIMISSFYNIVIMWFKKNFYGKSLWIVCFFEYLWFEIFCLLNMFILLKFIKDIFIVYIGLIIIFIIIMISRVWLIYEEK